MFQPVTITDDCQDETTVDVEQGDIVTVQVADQLLAAYLREPYVDSHAYARGVYDLDQAKALRDALSAAIADVEARQPGTFELVDGDGYLWVFVPEHDAWACALRLSDPDDRLDLDGAAMTRIRVPLPFWPPLAASFRAAYRGLDAWAEIAERFGIKG